MVSINASKKWLLQEVQCSEQDLLEALPQVKAGLDKEEGDLLSLEVTGDRPDLLSKYGVARALKGFFGAEKGTPAPKYPSSGVKIIAEKEALAIRPVIVGAIVENSSFSPEEVAEIFELQEKLDLTNGRRRKKVSIGLYDLKSLKPPFYFKAVDPVKTSFVPLKRDFPMSLKQILEEHEKGVGYAHLINKHSKYPVLVDSAGQLLSLVPIINNVQSAVTEDTKSFFIDHTATDFHAANASLNILCQDFTDAGARVKTVEIVYPTKSFTTPDYAGEKILLPLDKANKNLGIELTAKQAITCLEKQRISAREKKTGVLECSVPAYRADFLHWMDLVEELALGYGYNSFKPKKPVVFTKGELSSDTRLVEKVRSMLVGAGGVELLTHVTTSAERAKKGLHENGLVKIKNPVSSDYNALRNSLIPGLLEVLASNTHYPYPQKIFEVGEVIVRDARTETRHRTDLHACFATAHSQSSLTEAASVLSAVFKDLKTSFSLHAIQNPLFIPGRGGKIVAGEEEIGFVGEVHPAVLETYGLQMPVSLFEFTVKKGEK